MLPKHILILAFIQISLFNNSSSMKNRIVTPKTNAKFHVKPVIVKGKQAALNELSFMVSLKTRLQTMKPNDTLAWENLCGGSIISKYQVLTAAHCFEENDFYYKKHSNAVRVVAGSPINIINHSGATETTAMGQWRKISSLILHKKFKYPLHDIALINVDESFVFDNAVKYIRRAKIKSDYPLHCKSAGFGLIRHTAPTHPSPALLVANIETMTMQECDDIWGIDMSTFICTYSAVTDVSSGDSGGPMSCQGAPDTDSIEEPILVGVVSGKNFDLTTLFTRVSAYKDWIEKGFGSKLESNAFLVVIIQLMFIYVLFKLTIKNFRNSLCPVVKVNAIPWP